MKREKLNLVEFVSPEYLTEVTMSFGNPAQQLAGYTHAFYSTLGALARYIFQLHAYAGPNKQQFMDQNGTPLFQQLESQIDFFQRNKPEMASLAHLNLVTAQHCAQRGSDFSPVYSTDEAEDAKLTREFSPSNTDITPAQQPPPPTDPLAPVAKGAPGWATPGSPQIGGTRQIAPDFPLGAGVQIGLADDNPYRKQGR